MGAAKIVAELTLDDVTGAAVAAEMPATDAPQLAANKLVSYLTGAASGIRRGRLRVRVDDSTAVAASGTLVATGANIAAAEYLEFVTPGGRFRVTAVASGATAGDKTFNTSSTDNTVATNIRAAINTHPDLKRWIAASGGTNNVTITSKVKGAIGNSIEMVDGTTNGVTGEGLLTGGKDAAARTTATAVIAHANILADDTFTIGGTVLTWKASASGEDQVTIGADATEDGDNLVAKINAHSELVGLVSAANVTGTVTITYLCDPRAAFHMQLATSDGDSATLTQPSTTLTLASSLTTRSYNLGCGES